MIDRFDRQSKIKQLIGTKLLPWDFLHMILRAQPWQWHANGVTKDLPPDQQRGELCCTEFDMRAGLRPSLLRHHVRLQLKPETGVHIAFDPPGMLRLVGARPDIEKLMGVDNLEAMTPIVPEEWLTRKKPFFVEPGGLPVIAAKRRWYEDPQSNELFAFLPDRQSARLLHAELQSRGFHPSVPTKTYFPPTLEVDEFGDVRLELKLPPEEREKLAGILAKDNNILPMFETIDIRKWRQEQRDLGINYPKMQL